MAEPKEPTVAPIDRERVEEFIEAQPDVLKELSFGKYLSSLKEGRDAALRSPGMAQEQEARIDAGKPAFAAKSIPGALDYHAQRLGLTGDEYRQKASDLGVSVEFFEDTVGRKGFSPEEAKKMAAERGVAAFMPEGRRKVASWRLPAAGLTTTAGAARSGRRRRPDITILAPVRSGNRRNIRQSQRRTASAPQRPRPAFCRWTAG